jgi:hypothetical protein
MVVDFGESQVFEWEVPEFLNSLIRRHLPGTNLLKELAN